MVCIRPFEICLTTIFAILCLWLNSAMVNGQDVLFNCDPDDASCLCADLSNASSCFCDWGYVLDPDYTPSIGKMKFCTRNCKHGHLHCWTDPTSHIVCPEGEETCTCAFGYTATLSQNEVICVPVNCHKKYLLNDNELCLCPPHGMNSTEVDCECVDGFVGNKTTHPGFCKGFQCEQGEGSSCFCPNGPTDPTTCECQTTPGSMTKKSFLIEEGGAMKRKCIPGASCEEGEVLNSFGDNVTDCVKDECIKGTPFCDTGSVFRFCEDGFTANWDMTCIPVQCNDKILNTDVSYCTCPKNSEGNTQEHNCRCFVNYVSDFDKPGQCRTLCDVDMPNCVSEDTQPCTESNNQNCKCAEGFQAALLDTDKNGRVINVDSDGRLISEHTNGYNSQISGNKVGCVPICDDAWDAYCITDEAEITKCADGYTPNWNQQCVPYDCNAGFEPETYHCDCDQDAFGSFTSVIGLIIAEDSEFPLTCYCLPGYISAFMKEERFCKEQVCDPFTDPYCTAEANDDGSLRVETSSCNQWYMPIRDLSRDTDPEDSTEAWKAEYPPVCHYTQNVSYCQPGSFGCDSSCAVYPCECEYENGFTVLNGKCYQLTCDPATVAAQYPDGNGYQFAEQICTSQINPDFNRAYYYCTAGFFPNGTGGCDQECNSYFPECQKYADFNHFQCSFGYAPNLFVTTEGFAVDHTCIQVECNSIKQNCVCPSYYGQTKIKMEKDCECEMGYAADGFGGCQQICYKEGRAEGDGVMNCKRDCVGPVCKCDLGHSLHYDRDTKLYTCVEVDCHKGNGNCSCGVQEDGEQMQVQEGGVDFVKYLEETDCHCVNDTLPLHDGSCTEPILRSCVTCSSDDGLNACVEEVDINGIRGITTKLCDKHSGYFGCWVREQEWLNGSYYFERGCGYYCSDSYYNNTYCYTNQKGTDNEETICQQCCKDEDDCNILKLASFANLPATLQYPKLLTAILAAFTCAGSVKGHFLMT